jgi:hypothetical protein
MTEPIAVERFVSKQGCVEYTGVKKRNSIHIKNPNDAAEPAMYEPSIEMAPRGPLPNLGVTTSIEFSPLNTRMRGA